MKYKALLIDLDDTILDFKKAEENALSMVLKKYNIPVTDENTSLYSKINLSYWKRLEKNEVTIDEVVCKRWIDFFSELGIKDIPKGINDIYFDELKNGYFLEEDADKFLCKARMLFNKIYVISNGNPIVQYSRIEKAKIGRYFDKVFISKEIGYQKPNKEFFDFVINDIKIEKSECIVLGDSLTSDIKGAIDYNIDYIWYDKYKTNKISNKKIDKLMDFFDLI